jgi:hypothetical protein
LGIDYQRTNFKFSANKYFAGYSSLPGYDIALSSSVPYLPWLNLIISVHPR